MHVSAVGIEIGSLLSLVSQYPVGWLRTCTPCTHTRVYSCARAHTHTHINNTAYPVSRYCLLKDAFGIDDWDGCEPPFRPVLTRQSISWRWFESAHHRSIFPLWMASAGRGPLSENCCISNKKEIKKRR